MMSAHDSKYHIAKRVWDEWCGLEDHDDFDLYLEDKTKPKWKCRHCGSESYTSSSIGIEFQGKNFCACDGCGDVFLR